MVDNYTFDDGNDGVNKNIVKNISELENEDSILLMAISGVAMKIATDSGIDDFEEAMSASLYMYNEGMLFH